ncbi:hypothetical protein [Bradyrhizobium icense]|uniref:Uncharacterized protein n=1 Tax=Bradyrhizobium icense TaxID=1274631 RepID=A0A1B1UKS8_9BRAD|nr:hypothetical protein LMTR13_27485 [Bradyrhizobium icense]
MSVGNGQDPAVAAEIFKDAPELVEIIDYLQFSLGVLTLGRNGYEARQHSLEASRIEMVSRARDRGVPSHFE